MAQQQEHPIFHDIYFGDLEAVQQRVLADRAVMEVRRWLQMTPLMEAIHRKQPAIALWLIAHRGRHDVDAADGTDSTALHYASRHSSLELVQALVAAGADPARLNGGGSTPLLRASDNGHTDIVAFLLGLPAVRANIHHISPGPDTALSLASLSGNELIVQLLLDAGADSAIPAGPNSPLNQATSNNHHAVSSLLRHSIAMTDCARTLHKARCLFSAGAAALACLQGRLEQAEALPQVELTPPQQQQREKLRATAAFAVGVSGGEKDSGLCDELYVELLMYMLPAWADKGPALEEDDTESEEEGEDDTKSEGEEEQDWA